MEEKVYRQRVQATYDRIERVFDDVDPDLVECEVSQGALTLRFADGSKCILSAQPSVRQLWMAVAAKGVAYHFNFDEARGQWMDDKGRDLEALSYLTRLVKDATGLSLSF